MKKYLLILLAFFSLIIETNAQSRVNASGLEKLVLKTQSKVVTYNPSIVGWHYSKYQKKWYGWYGYITMSDYEKTDKIQLTSPSNFSKWEGNNLGSIQTIKLQQGTKTYYAIITTTYGGYYDYPYIEKGWHMKKYHNGTLLSEEQYNLMFNPPIGETIHIKSMGTGSAESFAACIKNIQEYIDKWGMKEYTGSIMIRKEDEKTMRFCFFGDLTTDYFEVSSKNWDLIKVK